MLSTEYMQHMDCWGNPWVDIIIFQDYSIYRYCAWTLLSNTVPLGLRIFCAPSRQRART